MAEPESVWMYPPSLALAILATILYGVIFAVLFYQTVVKHRAWFFTCVVIGAAIEVVGYALRSYSARSQTALVPFILTLTLVDLAPVFVAAGNYLLIGRLIRSVLPPAHHRVFGVPARLLTRTFVTFDVVSFFVQSAGSSVASSNEWQGPTERVGRHVLIGGLSFQCLTLAWYLAIFGRFHRLASRLATADAPRDWRKLVRAVYVSSSLIMIRSIYRVAEFAEGLDGYAFRHEWLFWVFEALPMLIAIGIFCVYHPSQVLGRDGGRRLISKETPSEELVERSYP